MKHYFKKQVNFLETNEMYMFYTIRYLKGHNHDFGQKILFRFLYLQWSKKAF